MPSVSVLRTLLRELTTSERVERVPEPNLVMDDPAKVAAYVEAGRADGAMAAVYLLNCAHACEVMRPGDLVVDLACGPANQLALIASLNPDVRFLGIDLSETMLAFARDHVQTLGLANVELECRDISRLLDIPDHSVDVVMSTMALHHLPTVGHLQACFAEVHRILKPGGGVYLADFGRLKSNRSIDYFAYLDADRKPALFVLDYLYSLRAAFSLADFRMAGAPIRTTARLYSTFLSPFMLAYKSAPRGPTDLDLRQRIRALRAALPPHHKADLSDLRLFFSLAGMRSRLLG